MTDFLYRKFVGFNAVEIDCSTCKCLASLKNPKCLDCVNSLSLSFDLLELKKNFSTVYFEKGLSDSIKNDNFHVFSPSIIPSFLNFYILPVKAGKVLFDGSEYNIVSSGSNKFLDFNPLVYNLCLEDLELFSDFVSKIQDENLSIDEVGSILPVGKDYLNQLIISYTKGLGLLDNLLGIKGVQDVYINSPGNNCLFFNHNIHGQLKSNIFLKKEMINKIGTFLRSKSGRPFDEAFPVLHSNIKHAVSRVCGITQPLSFNGSGFAIRKHSSNPFTLHRLVDDGFVSSEVAGFLWFLIDSEVSLLITGSRGSGKTTLLGGLLFMIEEGNRFIIIEDTKELPVDLLKEVGYNVEHLRTSSFENSESFEFTSDTALRTALRLGESVLVIGEVRSREAKTLFEAMRVGAAGNSVLGTIHGSTAFDTFDRIVNDLGVPPTSFKAADIVISCSYLKRKGRKVRKLVSVTEIGKEWFSNPRAEDGFFELVSFNPKSNKYSFGKLADSALLKRVAFNLGWSVKKCVSNIKLRGKIIDLVVEKGGDFLSPEKIIGLNSLFSSLIYEYDNKSILKKVGNYLNSVEVVKDSHFRDNILIKSLFNLKAFDKRSAVSTKNLFKELDSKISRSSFNYLLNGLESDGIIKLFKVGGERNWYLPKRVSKFLKS